MTTITKLLEEYHNGSADACEEILKRMMPLAKKYAGKIHCMDYEDALQELCLTILEALTADLPDSFSYDDSLLDIEHYIRNIPEAGGKRKILSLFFYEDLSDKEIAEGMQLSRQYVNRIRRQLIQGYFDQTK